jgi:hypothetical protein
MKLRKVADAEVKCLLQNSKYYKKYVCHDTICELQGIYFMAEGNTADL